MNDKLMYQLLHFDDDESHSSMQRSELGKQLESILLTKRVSDKMSFIDIHGMSKTQFNAFSKLRDEYISWSGDLIRVCDISKGKMKSALLVTTEGVYFIGDKEVMYSFKYKDTKELTCSNQALLSFITVHCKNGKEESFPGTETLCALFNELVECYNKSKEKKAQKADKLTSFDYDDDD